MQESSSLNERVSRLMDADLSAKELEILMEKGAGDAEFLEFKKNWALYQQVGDAIRSDELALPMSADFTARFAARLEAEPNILAPQMSLANQARAENNVVTKPAFFGRFGATGTLGSIAAAALIAFVVAPQLSTVSSVSSVASVAERESASNTIANQTQDVNSRNKGQANVRLVEQGSNKLPSSTQLVVGEDQNTAAKQGVDAAEGTLASANSQKGELVMLRDPNLDSYLLAHQKVSPSIGNNAHYVTPANVPSGSALKNAKISPSSGTGK
jgi:sigma-E factor negative regulatory protein RseA